MFESNSFKSDVSDILLDISDYFDCEIYWNEHKNLEIRINKIDPDEIGRPTLMETIERLMNYSLDNSYKCYIFLYDGYELVDLLRYESDFKNDFKNGAQLNYFGVYTLTKITFDKIKINLVKD